MIQLTIQLMIQMMIQLMNLMKVQQSAKHWVWKDQGVTTPERYQSPYPAELASDGMWKNRINIQENHFHTITAATQIVRQEVFGVILPILARDGSIAHKFQVVGLSIELFLYFC